MREVRGERGELKAGPWEGKEDGPRLGQAQGKGREKGLEEELREVKWTLGEKVEEDDIWPKRL